jgi:hypothetical protein
MIRDSNESKKFNRYPEPESSSSILILTERLDTELGGAMTSEVIEKSPVDVLLHKREPLLT